MDVEQIVREFIDKTIHLSLATVKNNKPWVSELHFAYDEELNLYWRSLKSRRHSLEIEDNSSVAGNIIDKHELGEDVAGIYFEGSATLLEGSEEKETAARCLAARLQTNESEILKESEDEAGHQFYKIAVKNWYIFGKFGADYGTKHKLEWRKK